MSLPQRKTLRLPDYDYAQPGAYFITMCVKDKKNLLWESVGARSARPQEPLPLSRLGRMIDATIRSIPDHYPDVTVDKYVIMPNHIHMILVFSGENGRALRAPTISTVINQMKGFVTKQIGASIWQKSYHDHIIRNEDDYRNVWQYIDANPQQWETDRYYQA